MTITSTGYKIVTEGGRKLDRNYTKKDMIFEFLRGSKRYYIFGLIAALTSIVLDMVVPQIIRVTVDSVIGDDPFSLSGFIAEFVNAIGGRPFLRSHIILIALFTVGISLVNAVFKYLNNLFNSKGAEKMTKTMRNILYQHIQRLPYSWHMKNQTGDIIQRCTSDVSVIVNFLSEYLVSIVRIVLLLSITLFFMYPMNLKLTIVAFCSIPIILTYSIYFRTKIEYLFKECDENEGMLSTVAQENLTSVRVVRAFGREKYEKDKFEKQNNIYTNRWLLLCKYLSGFWGIGDLVSGLQVMIIVTLGSILCVRGELSTGSFIAFISYNSMLIWPVRHLSRVVTELSKTGVSMDRLFWIMEEQEEKDSENAEDSDMTGDIAFENVSFAYEGENNVLSNISFEIKAGTVFGILGATGSGKSTLMHLLNRLYELPEGCGRITVGGKDIRDIKLGCVRKNIGMVLQEPYLFSRTIAENIRISADYLSMEDIRKAAATASLDETVMNFAKGYDTIVGERGITLSGGQKQRVAIARIIVNDVPIFVFDDSLSAVDTETDAKIQAALKERFKGSTVILISHRITTLMQADKILVLDKGKVAEIGTNDELLALDGIYKKVYDLQTAGLEVLR